MGALRNGREQRSRLRKTAGDGQEVLPLISEHPADSALECLDESHVSSFVSPGECVTGAIVSFVGARPPHTLGYLRRPSPCRVVAAPRHSLGSPRPVPHVAPCVLGALTPAHPAHATSV